jgi:hypothetical protein
VEFGENDWGSRVETETKVSGKEIPLLKFSFRDDEWWRDAIDQLFRKRSRFRKRS